MADPSIEDLRSAAATGDAEALTRLGEALVGASEPAGLAEAAAALDRATRAGAVQAPAQLAMLFAMGAGVPHSWTTALDLLRIAAERGSQAARGQLLVLAQAGPDGAGSDGDDWAQLRGSIDPRGWSRLGAQTVIRKSPRIGLYEGFVSPAACAWIMARAADRITPAKVFNPNDAGLVVDDVRTNGAFQLGLADMDVVLAMLRFRIAALVGVAAEALEPPQVLHYRVGQRFEEHFDFFDPSLPGHARDLTLGGQRIATCLVYLNADFEGGETGFPILGQRCKPPTGGALCFFNVQPTGAPDRRTLHAGLAPTRGEKWIVSQWIRDRSRA